MNRSHFAFIASALTLLLIVPSIGFAQNSRKAIHKRKATPVRRAKMSAQEIYRKYKDSIVRVETDKGTGTGFFFADGEAIVTCNHVVEGAHSLRASTIEGKDIHVDYIIVNKEADAAILSAKTRHKVTTPDLTFTSSPGDDVYVIGNPLGALTQSLTTGVLSAKRQVNNITFLQITAPVSPGSSGSPIFDCHGDVIGFVSFNFTQGQSLNMGVASLELLKTVKKSAVRDLSQFLADNTAGKQPSDNIADVGEQATLKDTMAFIERKIDSAAVVLQVPPPRNESRLGDSDHFESSRLERTEDGFTVKNWVKDVSRLTLSELTTDHPMTSIEINMKFTVRLADLDPSKVTVTKFETQSLSGCRYYVHLQTTDGEPTIREESTLTYSYYNLPPEPRKSDDKSASCDIVFAEPVMANRIANALRHAIRLSGGKTSRPEPPDPF